MSENFEIYSPGERRDFRQVMDNVSFTNFMNYTFNTYKGPRGVPRDPRFVFRAFYYFRLRFLTVIFFLNV